MKKYIENKEKLIILYDEMFPALCIQGRIMGAPEALVRDCIHDIFLDLLEKHTVLENIKNFKAYISISLRRKVAKEMKRKFSEFEERFSNPEKSYENFIIEQESQQLLKDKLKIGLQNLSPGQRQVLKLRFYDGLSYEEIAENQKSALRTVYNQCHSAMKILRKFRFN